MHPVLFQFGGFIVGTHNALIGLGVVCAALVFWSECRRRGELSEQMLWIVAAALVGGALGAKMSAVLGNASASPPAPLGAVVLHGGRSILGGLAGAYLAVVLTKRMVAFPRHTGDMFAPAVALGMAVGRWGCFLSELPGTPTTLPWGIRLRPLDVARLPDCPAYCQTSALHPSFIYEILFHATMVVVLWKWLRWQPAFRDEMLKFYLLCYAVFRFLVEFVRGHDVMWAALTGAQLFLLPVIALLVTYFLRRLRPNRASFATSGATLSGDPS